MSNETKSAEELAAQEKRTAWLKDQVARTCAGAQNQNVGEVLKRIEAQAAGATKDAARQRQPARAKQLEGVAKVWKALAVTVKQIADALEAGDGGKPFASLDPLFFADQPRDGGEGRVRTGRVLNVLIELGLTAEAGTVNQIARATCGMDLNPSIYDNVPEDGLVRFYSCPRCGMEHSARRVPAAVAADVAAATPTEEAEG